MTFAPATIAPGENLHSKPNVKPNPKPNPNPNHNLHIILKHKPYHNPNPNPMLNKELEPEQLSPEQMSCHRLDIFPLDQTGCIFQNIETALPILVFTSASISSPAVSMLQD